ncbi:MAG: flagellar hook-basal body complex protein FliE [Spirochaetae bacterium HGW-Spirochaetae-1]|jgi:flagellar hook-basal body complex protein FliE|nr:MAG: flagellar hook-basal body complex protein FliE [Spirochaetae bacterium HGW-Spirochaetae-1]
MNVDAIFTGNVVKMRTTDPLHYNNMKPARLPEDDISSSFAEMLKGAVNKVNNLQIDAEDLSEKMIYEPESVDIHTVMIAQQKAEISLSFAKTVRDEAIRAYRDIINLR